MPEEESYAKYHPETCPACGQDYEWIDVLESPRPGEEPDYVFVHNSELYGGFTRITESCRVHAHEANPEWEPSNL